MAERRRRYVRFQQLVGMEVYTEEGNKVGTVRDVTFDPETGDLKRLIVVVTEESPGGLIPIPGVEEKRVENLNAAAVKAVGDIVIVEARGRSEEEKKRSKEEGEE